MYSVHVSVGITTPVFRISVLDPDGITISVDRSSAIGPWGYIPPEYVTAEQDYNHYYIGMSTY